MTQEVRVERIPWAFIVIFLVLLGLLGEIWNVTQATGTWQRPAAYFSSLGVTVACYTALTALPFLTFFICGALGRLGPLKGKVNPTTMTYLYVMTCCASFFLGRPTADTQCAAWASFIGSRYLNPELSEKFVPWFMAPPLPIADQIRLGGVGVPWSELVPTIIFWSTFTIIFGTFMVCIATLFRRSWIDIEKVPFPHAVSAYELMKRVDPTKPRQAFNITSPFVIGMIIGIGYSIPSMMIELYPWFPDIYGFRTNICGYAATWNTPTGALGGIIGLTKWNIHPLAVAIAYIAPLNILFNVWFWWLVDVIILPQIAYVMGYYTALADRSGCGRWDCGAESLAFGPPFKWQATVIGGIFGLALFLFVIERRYIAETMKIALGSVSEDKRSEIERNEALSYRNLYAVIVVLFIMMVAILMTTGMGIGTAVSTPISMFILWFAQMRMLGLSGAYVRGTDKGYALQKMLFYPTAPDPPTGDFIMTANFNTWFTDAPDMGNQIGGNYLTAWQSYRIASLTGVSNKSVFKIMIVSIVILAPTTMIGFLYSAYTWGASRLPGTWGMWGCAGWYQRCAVPERWNAMPGTDPWVPNFLAGFLMAGVLSVMHARFMWFPFEPVGFIIGTSWTSAQAGFWLPCLVAWILKILTIRVGGSKLYEHQGLALAAGFIAGYMVCIIPGTIISKIRFFYPF